MSILFAEQFFLAGLLLADFYVADWRGKPSPSWRWDLVSCACWPVVLLMPDRAGWIAFPYLVLLLYIGAFRGVFFRRLFRNAWITTAGGMCYTIYLLHYRLIPLILHDSKLANNSAAVAAATYLFALSIASVLYFVLIERPCMDRAWPRRFVKKLALGLQRLLSRDREGAVFDSPS